MTTETDRAGAARPRGIGRIDPALRDAAAGLDVNEFQAESLPAERERADRIAADRAAAVDTGNVADRRPGHPGPGRPAAWPAPIPRPGHDGRRHWSSTPTAVAS